jgi:type VI secretion system secreted protein Hcp
MAFDTFLDLAGVEGESTAKGFENKIEIYSFSWGASNPTTVGSGATGLSASKVSISSFNIMKKTEKSSPTLLAACCNGKHFDTALVGRR